MDFEDKLFQRVINFISYRDRTEWEIRQYLTKKLKHKKAKKQKVEEIIEELVQKLYDFNLLNDRKFVENWIRSRMKSKFHGPRRLELDLRKKGIKKEIIEQYLSKVSLKTWLETARRLLMKKDSQLKRKTAEKRRQGVFRLLTSRGFSYDIAKRVSDAYLAGD